MSEIDPLEMLLDAARFIERTKPAWAKTARQAVARAREASPRTPQLPCPVCGNEAIHAIDILERTVIQHPIAWDSNNDRRYEPVETLAKEIYDGFVYDGPPGSSKPRWTPAGNGIKQDEARFEARRRLREAGHNPGLSRPDGSVLSPADNTTCTRR